jgi:hypothetical protein
MCSSSTQPATACCYSTYLGERQWRRLVWHNRRRDRAAYVAGDTNSSTFPVLGCAFDTSLRRSDAFIAKFTASARSLIPLSSAARFRTERRAFALDGSGTTRLWSANLFVEFSDHGRRLSCHYFGAVPTSSSSS